MLSLLDLRGTDLTGSELRARLPRAQLDIAAAVDAVAPLMSAVRLRGAQALREQALRFDHVCPQHLRVPAKELAAALHGLDPQVRTGLEEAIARTRAVHSAQVPKPFTVDLAPGAQVRQRWLPVERVGLYVPGGLAVYPSSVIMNVVPALCAGVASLAVASPPQAAFGGLPHPTVLAACALLGVEEVYAVGGAGAIAMFAYGAYEGDQLLCDPVAVVTGPGNVYVAAAKRLVRGVVGIDAEAGPTEIAILADETARAEYVAADLISQAEHDELAAAVLVTSSPRLATAVQEAIEAAVPTKRHHDRIVTSLSGQQSGIVLVDDLAAGLAVVNAYAAEHLEIHTREAAAVAEQVKAAGAIFVGPASPVPLGDYLAGSNHVLPTGGSGHYASGLGVHSFLRAVQVIEYTPAALAAVTDLIVAVSEAEDLPAHGQAAAIRKQ